jgi:hypothetical protein
MDSSQVGQTHLMQLPTELLLMILEFQSYPNIHNMKLASSTYYRLLKEDYETLKHHKGNWTFKHQSYRSWYQICLGQMPEETNFRMTKFESHIHPKLFYLHIQLNRITEAIRYEQKILVTEEQQCEVLLRQQFIQQQQKSNYGIISPSVDVSVTLLPSSLFQMYFWLAKIQKEIGIQQMVSDSDLWLKQIFSARRTRQFNKQVVKELFNMDSRTTYVMVYIANLNSLAEPTRIINDFVTSTSKRRRNKTVQIISISKKLEYLQKYEDKYVSLNGTVKKRQLFASMISNEIK